VRYGILSDIHANREALDAVLSVLSGSVDRYLVLGDVVGYGAEPNECMEIVCSLDAVFVKGNHEAGIVSGDLSLFSEDARAALEWTKQVLDGKWLEQISAWPETVEVEDILVFHGAPWNPLFAYLRDPAHARRAFPLLHRVAGLHGHTHFPQAYRQQGESGKVEIVPADFNGRLSVSLLPGYRYLLNAGSIGQPRDGWPEACAAVLDTSSRTFTVRRVPYDTASAGEKIRRAGLPPSLASRIHRGA